MSASAAAPPAPVLLMSQASDTMFHSTHNALLAATDGRLVTYWSPNVYFIDPAIATHTSTKTDLPPILSRGATILPSFGFRAELLAADGSYHTFPVSMLAATLLQACKAQQWRQAMALARSHSDTLLWALLAAMGLAMQQVDVAELAFAQLDEVDKVEYMSYIRSLPSAPARAAELLLYSHRPDDAQRLLMQSGLTYRAIKLCIRTFRWEKALALAVQSQQHVDTVLYHRQLYLSASKAVEDNSKFIDIAQQVNVDAASVLVKEKQEQQQEEASGNKYQGHFLSAE
jgi:intraflagellar transport protein 80